MRGKSLLAGAALVGLVIVAYFPILFATTIWDDDRYLVGNPLLRTVPGLLRIWKAPLASVQYYPVVFTSFWLEYHLWGLNFSAYHAINIMLHGGNAVMVWRTLKRLGVSGAWVAAAVFALHPVHVESVAWITERKNVLSGAFYLGALLAYLRFARRLTDQAPPPPATRSVRCKTLSLWYVVAFVLYLGALGSKTVTCSLPAAILLVTWWKRGRITISDVLPLVPFFAMGLAASSLTAWLEVHHVGARGPEWSFSTLERVLIAGRALWFYAGKLIAPVNLMFIYPRWRIDARSWWQYLYPLTALAVLGTLWTLRGRVGRGPLTGALYFGGTLIPALGFFDVYPMRFSLVADHFQYLASLGLLVLMTVVAVRFLDRARLPAWGRTACVGTGLSVLGLLTLMRTPAFLDTPAIWQDTLTRNPGCVIANTNLGAYFQQIRELDRARPYLEAALRIDPNSVEARYLLGAILESQGDIPGAEIELTRALELDPRYWRAHFALGLVRQKQGRLDDAAREFRATLSIDPEYSDALELLHRVEILLPSGARSRPANAPAPSDL